MADITQLRRIGLVLQGDGFPEGVFHGVMEYARPHRPWALYRVSPTVEGIRQLAQWGADGLIGQLADPAAVAAVLETGLPAINISGIRPVPQLVSVLTDNVMVGELAADHLYSRGCRHFAFVGQDGSLQFRTSELPLPQRLETLSEAPAYVQDRRRGFRHALADLGAGQQYSELLNLRYTLPTTSQGRGSETGRWLMSLPKPVGLFCSIDALAFHIHALCRDCGLDLVRDVIIVGVNNQRDFCEAAYPSFSSVEPGMLGFRCAETLERMISGERVARVIIVPPRRVVARGGDTALPRLPPEVQAVIDLIASHAGKPLQVADLLGQIPISRRAIEVKFRQATGRSIYQEIQRQRVERAMMLLTQTHWPIERVGTAAGFADPRQFSRTFRQHAKCTPRDYRRRTCAERAAGLSHGRQ